MNATGRSEDQSSKNTSDWTSEYRENSNGSEDQLELLGFIRGLWRRKWLITACVLVCAVLGYLLASSSPNQYTARSTVMLDPREQSIVSSQDQVVSDLKLSNPILESEVAVLRSSRVLEAVVEQIGIDRFDGVDPANMAPGLVEQLITMVKKRVADLTDAQPVEVKVNPLVSPEERRLGRIVGALRSGIVIARVGNSYVIEITVTTIDPELSSTVANTIAEVYIQRQLNERKVMAESATVWLSEQVEKLRLEVEAAESAVDVYQRDQLVRVGSSTDVVQQQLGELNQQLAIARSERATEEARLGQIEESIANRGAGAAAETLSTPFLISLRQQREDLLREEASLAVTLGPNHPERRNVTQELERVTRTMETEVAVIIETHQNEIQVLMKREDSLREDVVKLETQLADISRSSLSLNQLEREAEAARASYEDLLTRLGETRAQVEIQRAEAQLINAAQIPVGPSAPRVKLVTAFGGTVGLTVGLVLALVLEILGVGFMRATAIEKQTGLPVLATLPKEKFKRPRGVLRHLQKNPYSQFSERVRQLRTVVNVGARGTSQSVLVLSSIPNEGKTTTAIALAMMLERGGQKTVLVDLDTRRSNLERELLQGRPRNLSGYAKGSATLDDVICTTPSLPFDMIVSGQRSNLIADGGNSEWLHRLLQELKTRYDVVVIDIPPILAVSDALSLAGAVDQILYLVRWRTTPRRAVLHGLSVLGNVGMKPTGIVMSISDSSADPDVYSYEYT